MACCHLPSRNKRFSQKICGNNRGFAGGADGQRSDDHGWNGFTDDADACLTTSAEVTSKGSLVVRESYPKWPEQIQVKDL